MKKVIVIALAVVMMVSALAVFAACGTTYEGRCHYNSYGVEYGVVVKVTVNGDTITNVKLLDDSVTNYVRTSPNREDPLWNGHDATESAYESYLSTYFIGKTVDEVMSYVATASEAGQSVTDGPIIQLKGDNLSSPTAQQSSARIIVAVQDALSQIKKAD